MTLDLVTLIHPYVLLFARFSSLLTITIGFGDHQIPIRFRLLFALGLTLLLKDVIPSTPSHTNDFMFFTLVFQEVVIGVAIGLLGRMLIAILDIAGNIISLQIGLGNAMMFNPGLGSQAPITSTFLTLSGTFLFFMMDLHHLILHSLIGSYQLFPMDGTLNHFSKMKDATLFFTEFMNKGFIIASQLALPFLILGIVFQFMLGLLNRLVPSVQIFFIMLPAQILLGFALLMITIVSILSLFSQDFTKLYQSFPGFRITS